ncbi:MAG: ABC transporter ATP-binding protein [Clostridia bacterium]|nr:ABC transporter ATP-binding protein [Clostridia bacterium]
MKRLLKYLKYYKKETVLGPLFKLLEASLELIVPLIIAAVIDRGIATGDTSYVVKMCLLLVLLGAVGLFFSVTAQYFAAKASVGFVTRVRHALFGHMQKFSYSDIDELGSSGMITKLTADSDKVQSGLNLTLRLLLRSPFVVFGAMIMAFTVDATSALTFAAVIPVLAVVVFGIMLITMPLYKKVQGGVDKILRKTRENISGVRVIRAFGKEEDEISEFKDENEKLTKIQKRTGHVSALMNPLTYVIINVGIIALINVGALRVYEDPSMTKGDVVALYNYMAQILVELIKLANLIISITKALASASRIADVLDKEPSQSFGTLENSTSASDYYLEFENVSLRYRSSGEDSLTGISFKVRRGETLGIIGGTGSGKTSLINLIPRFYDATGGSIKLFGEDIKNYSEAALRRKIACVPQKAVLFRGTIRENMCWGNPDAEDDELLFAIDTAQAAEVVSDKGGLDARVEQGGRNFSGGQRQRLTIARAIAAKPEILILDDSFSALDYATDAALRRKIRERIKDTTVVIVSQRASSVMDADLIVALDDGEAVGIGTHEELLSGCEIYREIYESQFGGAGNG